MTLIVGTVDTEAGTVHLAGDSKVTWNEDPTRSRRIYKEPALKIIRLSENLAVGYAGAGPDTLAREIGALVGLDIEAVLVRLTSVSGATFIVAGRNPVRLWKVEDGEWGEVTSQGMVIAGNDEQLNGPTVFEVVRARYGDFPNDDARTRLMSTMQHLIRLIQPSSIGGLLVMLSASHDQGFRYDATPSTTFNAIYPGEAVEHPLCLKTLPGTGDTPGAVAFWIDNPGIGHLFTDGAPHVRHEIRSATATQFAATAKESFDQSLLVPNDVLTDFFSRA